MQHCSAVHVQWPQSHGQVLMQYGKCDPWFLLQHVTSTMSFDMVTLAKRIDQHDAKLSMQGDANTNCAQGDEAKAGTIWSCLLDEIPEGRPLILCSWAP